MSRVVGLLALAAGMVLCPLRGADDHVGVCTHFDQGWSVPQIMPLIARSGAGWIRDGVPWKDVEPEKGKYRIPARTTAWLNAAHAAHLKVLMVLGYGNKIYTDPFSPPAYARAAAFLSTRLAGRIDAIEVLNEPNNPDFGPTYGGKWNGKEDDGSVSPYVRAYVKVLTATVAAVKKANSRMLVVGYGAPAPATFRMIALGPPPLLDGITDHPYSGGRRLPEWIPYAATPELVQRDGLATANAEGTYRSQCAMFRMQESKFGLHAALWNTEWGYSTAQKPNDKEDETVSPDTQAVYVVRRLLEARALGVMTFYYLLRDDGGDVHQAWQNFGLLDINLKPKPAFYAFQRFTHDFASLQGDETADGFSLLPAAGATGETRCYAYHDAGKKNMWVACWSVEPWPRPEYTSSAGITPRGPNDPAKLRLPTGCQATHAEEVDYLTGHRTPLQFIDEGGGIRSVDVLLSGDSSVVHFYN